MNTPWGQAQTIETEAGPGLQFVSTSSHGGYHLSRDRAQVLRETWPGFRSWTGSDEWLEEDCDAAAAVLLWPELFEGVDVFNAVRSARDRDDIPADWWDSAAGRVVVDLAAKEASKTSQLWERGSM